MDRTFEYLINIALDAKIGVEFAMFAPNTPSMAKTSERFIVLNRNWHNQKELNFQFAHEISHIINGDGGILYYTTAVSHTKIEGNANIGAIKLLVPFYFQDVDYSTANVDNFINEYQIPIYLREKCIEEIEKFYKTFGETS